MIMHFKWNEPKCSTLRLIMVANALFLKDDGVSFIVLMFKKKKNICEMQHRIFWRVNAKQEKRHRRRVRAMTNNAKPTKLDLWTCLPTSKSHRMRDKIKWMNNRTDWELLNYMNFDGHKKLPFFFHVSFPFTDVVVNINIHAHRYISQSSYSMLLMMALIFDFDRLEWILCGALINRNTCKIDCFINEISRWWFDCNQCL